MNKLKADKAKSVIQALVEGVGVNAAARMTGVSKPTILKLQKELGCAAAHFHHDNVRGLKPKAIQCDEIWAFVHCKQKNVAAAKSKDDGIGDVWTWTAIDPDTKLIISYQIGLRTPEDAREFMMDLAGRVNDITQLTTDGFNAYPEAVREAFGDLVDYAQLIKTYRQPREDHARYSPAVCTGCVKKSVVGMPDADQISTSIVERSNLTMRMSMRRYTRLTNGHSKKVENHGHAVALFFMYYNYCRKHMSLKGKTPAMAAGLADHVWTLDELIGLIN